MAEAWKYLADLHRFGPDGPLLEALEAAGRKAHDQAPGRRRYFLAALGKAREDRGDFDGAFPL